MNLWLTRAKLCARWVPKMFTYVYRTAVCHTILLARIFAFWKWKRLIFSPHSGRKWNMDFLVKCWIKKTSMQFIIPKSQNVQTSTFWKKNYGYGFLGSKRGAAYRVCCELCRNLDTSFRTERCEMLSSGIVFWHLTICALTLLDQLFTYSRNLDGLFLPSAPQPRPRNGLLPVPSLKAVAAISSHWKWWETDDRNENLAEDF